MGESSVKTLETRTDVSSPTAVETETRPGSDSALLSRLRAPRRPRIWFEVLLIAVSYWTYSLIRNAVPEQKTIALANADWIWGWSGTSASPSRSRSTTPSTQ